MKLLKIENNSLEFLSDGKRIKAPFEVKSESYPEKKKYFLIKPDKLILFDCGLDLLLLLNKFDSGETNFLFFVDKINSANEKMEIYYYNEKEDNIEKIDEILYLSLNGGSRRDFLEFLNRGKKINLLKINLQETTQFNRNDSKYLFFEFLKVLFRCYKANKKELIIKDDLIRRFVVENSIKSKSKSEIIL